MVQRSKEAEKALKKIVNSRVKSRNAIVEKTCPKMARAFLEMWVYLDTFADSKVSMEYAMVKNIFGSFNREQVTEVFNAIGSDR